METGIDFTEVIDSIVQVIREWESKLVALDTDLITTKRNKQNRTIKQILGHLIDSASNNHQRMVRLQYNKDLTFPDYQQDNDRWIALQGYQHTDWNNLIQLWKFYNLHIIQVINSIDPSSLSNQWTNFKGANVSLKAMIKDYPGHLHLHMNEIEALINC